MKINNRHERVLDAPPERIAELLADLDCVWPTQLMRAPRPYGEGLIDAGVMVWQEIDRPGAARAFRVVSPAELRAEHWFETVPDEDQTLLRHIVDGEAVDAFEAIWREGIEPVHDRVLEALFDNVENRLRSGTGNAVDTEMKGNR